MTSSGKAALGLQPAEQGIAGSRLYLDQGQDHVASALLAYGDSRIYPWLLEQRLETPT